MLITSGAINLCFFFFNDTATTEIYTLSLHDALPILPTNASMAILPTSMTTFGWISSNSRSRNLRQDRKSTRLNSSHITISYAVFCLKKKKKTNKDIYKKTKNTKKKQT